MNSDERRLFFVGMGACGVVGSNRVASSRRESPRTGSGESRGRVGARRLRLSDAERDRRDI
jgi:hypothetical protein